ncbi:hypothetical protein EDC01DRAFT_198170 [Geopyxis carbonaria]|nr:hypothetical protein EDC01DRAFT_198170 [Geopyxis carbonaria]
MPQNLISDFLKEFIYLAIMLPVGLGGMFLLPPGRLTGHYQRQRVPALQKYHICRYLDKKSHAGGQNPEGYYVFHYMAGKPAGKVRCTRMTCLGCIFGGGPMLLCNNFCFLQFHFCSCEYALNSTYIFRTCFVTDCCGLPYNASWRSDLLLSHILGIVNFFGVGSFLNSFFTKHLRVEFLSVGSESRRCKRVLACDISNRVDREQVW